MRIYGAIEVQNTYDDVVNILVDSLQKRVPTDPATGQEPPTAILFLTHPTTNVSHVVYTGVEITWEDDEFRAFLADIKLLLPYTTGLGRVIYYDGDYLDTVITIRNGEIEYGNS